MQNMILVLYPLFCILLPCMLYVLIQTKGFHRRTNFIHMIWVFIFLYYVYLVLETTGIGTIWEIGLYPGMKLQEEINLIPFRDGISLSMILNVVMFMPLGFLLPLLWKEYQSLVRTAIIGFCFSCGIEFCQLFNRRVSDVDDLLMNTLGAILGWLIWIVFSRITHLKYGRRNQGFGGKEGAVYLALSLVGQFFLYNWRWMI
ncbi:VanZ family protein [Mediterraneibacter gnavus]|uniref:VanZ family protein n=1 Tax=Mediterraneibacter gnavus TaxID=33038 RepID=A0A414UZ71_MEDGN|nr:VanZ family protein [Mediterraneibacter gnavus]RHG75468.1 VanZ family protein [Mediterraneibacter gnavus]RHG87853.1 VanZ family protein [Mediterraneibacter gnavus]